VSQKFNVAFKQLSTWYLYSRRPRMMYRSATDEFKARSVLLAEGIYTALSIKDHALRGKWTAAKSNGVWLPPQSRESRYRISKASWEGAFPSRGFFLQLFCDRCLQLWEDALQKSSEVQVTVLFHGLQTPRLPIRHTKCGSDAQL